MWRSLQETWRISWIKDCCIRYQSSEISLERYYIAYRYPLIRKEAVRSALRYDFVDKKDEKSDYYSW